MLSPEEIATIKTGIEKLKRDLDVCTDVGLRKLLETLIEQQEQKLQSERASK
jgi:hypothetical protein